MQIFTCFEGCCTLKINSYISNKNFLHYKTKKKMRKSGIFIYDPICNKILIVQSNGNLWGSPKGSIEYNETDISGAIREVFEETGLLVSIDNFTIKTSIQNNASYFYLEKEECDVSVQEHIKNNDANGIGWIKPECLKKSIINGNISITHHFRIIVKRFLNYEFPYSNFISTNSRKSN